MKTDSLIDRLKAIGVPDVMTDEFYDRLMYEKVSQEQFDVEREQ
jgi:hypothetical protein